MRIVPAAGWQRVRLDRARRTVRIPAGVEIDLGATAKALAADRSARRVHAETGAGALVNLGGDIALAGPAPEGGWPILVTDDHRSDIDAEGQTIALAGGGLATSSTTVRRWRAGEADVHHIVDPRSGAPADEVWRTVSVAAPHLRRGQHGQHRRDRARRGRRRLARARRAARAARAPRRHDRRTPAAGPREAAA